METSIIKVRNEGPSTSNKLLLPVLYLWSVGLSW